MARRPAPSPSHHVPKRHAAPSPRCPTLHPPPCAPPPLHRTMDLYPPFREEFDKKFSSADRLEAGAEDPLLLCHAAAIYHVFHTATARRCRARPWPRAAGMDERRGRYREVWSHLGRRSGAEEEGALGARCTHDRGALPRARGGGWGSLRAIGMLRVHPPVACALSLHRSPSPFSLSCTVKPSQHAAAAREAKTIPRLRPVPAACCAGNNPTRPASRVPRAGARAATSSSGAATPSRGTWWATTCARSSAR